MHAQGYTTLQLYSLLFVATRRTVTFVAACHTVCYLLLHVVQLCFVAACHTVCYLLLYAVELLLLLHAVQFAACCCTPYSLLFGAAHHTVAFVAACLTVCCSLPHAVQFAICGCSIQLLFFAAHRTVVFGCRMPYSLLFAVVL